jgi:hypothetical protein
MDLIWLGAVAIGLSVGLLGSGGSLLTLPTLTFLVGQPEKVAVASSLAIVGSIALVACIPYALRGQVDKRSVLLFGIPGMAGTALGAWASQFVSGSTQMMIFAVVVLAAAGVMWRPAVARTAPGLRPARRAILEGSCVGLVTGFVGVGGGFLIVPALVMAGLSVHVAIGTSLVIIAAKSATGLLTYMSVLSESGLALDPLVVGSFAVVGVLGSVLGGMISVHLPQAALQRTFAGMLIVVGGWVVIQGLPTLI